MNSVLGHVADRPAPIAELDYAVVSLAALLLGIGLVMVYSSSAAIAEAGHYTGNQPAYFLIRHSVFVFVGAMAGFICFQFPMRLWQQAAPYLFVLGVLLLLMVLSPASARRSTAASAGSGWGLSTCSPLS